MKLTLLYSFIQELIQAVHATTVTGARVAGTVAAQADAKGSMRAIVMCLLSFYQIVLFLLVGDGWMDGYKLYELVRSRGVLISKTPRTGADSLGGLQPRTALRINGSFMCIILYAK